MIEVNAPDKTTRRRRGKTDAVDAEAAAHAVLSGRATAAAKAGDGPVEMVRLFKLAKTSATKSRAQAINQLKAVLVRADPALREALSGLSNHKLIRSCAALDTNTPTDATAAAAYTLRLLAHASSSSPTRSTVSTTGSPRRSPPTPQAARPLRCRP